ncbi:MAG TPA: hypothetical protein VFG20_10275 [Planctomycetaceae bacterium]|nr:hypothetical protein [Planctomycetaceae bacterium]
MAERNTAANPAANKFKLLLIPVLGVIMLYVLFAPGEVAPVPKLVARPPVSSSSTESAVGVTAVTVPGEPQAQPVKWPSIPLADVLQINPFQRPESLKSVPIPPPLETVEPITQAEPVEAVPPPITAEQQAAREEAIQDAIRAAMKTHRLSALVRTRKGLGAMVGDRVVMVGDKLDDRFRIAAIRADGLVLELIEPAVKTVPDTAPQ